tara:strand:+ start:180 stop:353 length:174 start_codon:yes stop_codon:yes gene_type:complete
MKVTKSKATVSKQPRVNSNNINNSKQGITSILLEKYKPKNPYTVKDKSERFEKKRVA